MIALSVNLNKVALIRNSRGGKEPDVLAAARTCLDAGCHGITLHPRPDRRHALPEDLHALRILLRPPLELNVEGRPTDEFLALVREVRPDQCTLVPDAPHALTSNHGWDLATGEAELRRAIVRLHDKGIRVSLFMDADPAPMDGAKALGADRIELYTGPYAAAFDDGRADVEQEKLCAAAKAAVAAGLEVNAGHDLTIANLPALRDLPGLKEVSIGHHLICHALDVGLRQSVLDYLAALGK